MQRKWLILTSVSLGSLMSTLDGSIVNIALPAIQQDFGTDLTTVEWVVVAYLLIVGSLLLPAGRLGEVQTFRRVYLLGFAVFTGASVLCGLAPHLGILIGFRAIQGIGAAMMMAMGPAIVARTFGPGERGRALGFNAIAVAIGLSLGPVLGGVLTQLGTWRAIFLINLPIGLIAIAWAARILPAEQRGRDRSFDLLGASLSGLSLFSLLLALSQGDEWGWSSPLVLGLVGAFIVLGVAFIVVERRAIQPLIDLALFRIRSFAAGLASVVIVFSGLFTATFLLPFLLEQVSGLTPSEAGLLLTPVPISMAMVAPLSGSASDRWGPSLPAGIGVTLMTVALASLAFLPVSFTVPELLWRLVLLGVGQGLFMSPNSSAVLGSVPGLRVGTASGMLAQMRVVGQTLGIAISAAIVAVRLPFHLAAVPGSPTGDAQRLALAGAIHDAFLVAALITAVAIATSLIRGSGRPIAARETPHEDRGAPSGHPDRGLEATAG